LKSGRGFKGLCQRKSFSLAPFFDFIVFPAFGQQFRIFQLQDKAKRFH
jgi:hypothetical protein